MDRILLLLKRKEVINTLCMTHGRVMTKILVISILYHKFNKLPV